MRFFGWTWAELMEVPITGFWTCRRHMGRLRAAERLDALQQTGVANASTEDRRNWVESQQIQIGTVVVEDFEFSQKGWDALKQTQ